MNFTKADMTGPSTAPNIHGDDLRSATGHHRSSGIQDKSQVSSQKNSIPVEESRSNIGAELLAESRRLGWHSWQAEAYRYRGPQKEAWGIPGIEDVYVIELQTSPQPVVLEQKLSGWSQRRWHRGSMVFIPLGQQTEWR
jgi:hypothetical protein